MNVVTKSPSNTALLLSGNEAVARAAWESGVAVASAYPGTPSTEILEAISAYAEVRANWAPNEKVALEIAIGASLAGARALAAMKHVGLNVASDALMSQTLAGVAGGLVLAVADDVGLSSSQNEQDSRYWGRFAHLPILEPCDSREAYELTRRAFALSEEYGCPVILRLTTAVCHVKSLAEVGRREEHPAGGFARDPSRYVLVPANARRRLPVQQERDRRLRALSASGELFRIEEGSDARVGFITSGPAYLYVKECFPEAPVFKMALTHPLPVEAIREFTAEVGTAVVVEETEPLVETELRAAGVPVRGKDLLPAVGELTPPVLRPAVAPLLGGAAAAAPATPAQVFPRPPTLCVGCPHLSAYYCLSRLHKQTIIAGDIGCYTLGAGHPWNALDTTTCMGASMGMALGLDLGRGETDKDKGVIAVIGDSTFLHMGMQGLLALAYNRANVTVLILNNDATGMTGGQEHPGTGKDLRGQPAPRVDLAAICRALGVRDERIHVLDPYEMPTFFKVLKQEVATPEPSVVITTRPCTLTSVFQRRPPYTVVDDACTGCGNCLNAGCPAISVTRRETERTRGGKEVVRSYVAIDTMACTGCSLCAEACGPGAIQLAAQE